VQAGRVDRHLIRYSERRRSRWLDELFTGISRAANRSLVWFVVGGVLAARGGLRGRRAAAHGFVAIGLASAAVNGPGKLLVRRARPTWRVPLVPMPRSTSFPSGHAASAFAFAVAASRELPAALLMLVPLAAMVSYSRVYVGVHYPSDVLLGAALGAGAVAEALLVAATGEGKPQMEPMPSAALPELVLVVSPHAGRSSELARARRGIDRLGLAIRAEVRIDELNKLPELSRRPNGAPPRMIVAAGGDGTVGSVADALVGAEAVLGVLPLGTSNDFARSLGIPVEPDGATQLLAKGKISTVDLGRLVSPARPPRHFVHAATVGLNVNFAKLATRASLRAHLGRLTYLAAALAALRERPTFECDLLYRALSEHLTLSQLSVINAPIFGGGLGMRVAGDLDDRLLDVLAFEELPLHRIVLAALFLLLRVNREVRGVHALHLSSLTVHTDRPLDVALDGELTGSVPGQFEVAAEALRVITPLDFQDRDEAGPEAVRRESGSAAPAPRPQTAPG
jgi:undecaprenyl-diphosphatase